MPWLASVHYRLPPKGVLQPPRRVRQRNVRSATPVSRPVFPTVCAETCVGRMRPIGVFLYDADRVTEAASVPDEKDLYEAQLSLMLDHTTR